MPIPEEDLLLIQKEIFKTGRGRGPFVRQTSENDPYDMPIAPKNIYESQMLLIGKHNTVKKN